MNATRLAAQLILHEGLRLTPYVDTEGNWTIGVGYNITGRGWSSMEEALGRAVAPKDGMTEKARITKAEAMQMLRADITRVEQAVRVHFPTYDQLNEVRQRVVMDMAFNMGFKALGFHQTIEAIKQSDWSRAAREMYKSKWARQVGDGEGGRFDRCDRLSKMLLTGVDYTS
jgi:lysozyme